MDLSKVSEVVTREGYPIMIDSYDAEPMLFPQFCEVVPGSDETILGDKGVVLTGLGRLEERLDGADIESDELRTAYTWYMKTHQFSRKVSFSERQLKAADATGRIPGMIRDLARSWGENARLQKEDWVADVLQQGTLTAGNATYFDGSFIGQSDPNPTVIYDGLPFFDTAHTQAIGGNTFANHVVSGALTLANLQTAWTTMTMTNAYDDRNEKVRIRPDTLIVPPGLEATARVLLESAQLPGTAQNDVNTERGKYQLVVNPHLDDAASASAWWLCQARKGLRMVDFGEPVLSTWFDENKKVVHVSAETHWGVVVTNWRHWYCSNKAAS